jgi:hypothetical protein
LQGLTPRTILVIRIYQLSKGAVIHYYLARDLAHRLDINLAKWKRWSREFLPPDPLGGLQSGFARQYSLKEALMVALGGYLVGELRFSVPEARRILEDLGPWLLRTGSLQLRLRSNGEAADKDGDQAGRQDGHRLIFVRPDSKNSDKYLYWLTSLAVPSGGAGLANDLPASEFFNFPGVRLINLGGFLKRFYGRIK